MILTVIIIIAIAIATYFALKKAPLVDDTGKLVKENLIEPEKDATNVEVKAEKVLETSEELAKRLDKISNPDKNKPFAKISTPDASEMVSETIAPKKAPKKPRAPKVVNEETGEVNIEEAVTPKKKRYYKKRAPKKAE